MQKTMFILMIIAGLTSQVVACGDDDSSSSGGDGDGDSMGAGGSMMAGDGDGDSAGDGDGDATGDGDGDGDSAAPGTIVDVAVAAGSFTQLAAALDTANLVETLQGDGPFTVFAPTDAAFDAFEAANPGVLAGLSVDELTAILTYHVVAAEVMSGDLVDGMVALTVNGSPIAVDLSDGVKVGGATVSTPDVEASNGVIHIIDSIILPPADDIVATAVGAGDFTQLAAALTTADLVGALQGDGPFTVFAPNDAAFDAFEAANPGVLAGLSVPELTDILLYHVVEGAVGAGDLVAGDVPTLLDGSSVTVALDGGVTIDNANVVAANIIASNGVIHVIDTIILP